MGANDNLRIAVPQVPKFMNSFFVMGSLIQIIILVCFCVFTTYKSSTGLDHGYSEGQYGLMQDVNIMIFIGFAFLFVLLPKYGWCAVSIVICMGAMTIEWSVITNGWLVPDQTGMNATEVGGNFVSLNSMTNGIFAAASVLIATAGILGRTSMQQLVIMMFFMVPAYSFNQWLVLGQIGAADTGGTIYIHSFGAFFGFAVSFMLGHDKSHAMKRRFDETANYETNLMALIGTLFLWCYYPSFNAYAVGNPEGKFRATFNTQLGLIGAAVTSVLISDVSKSVKKNKMIHLQTGILAGGVTIGTLADQPIQPWGALLLGSVGGLVCCIGIAFVTPFIEKVLKVHDTCDCMALHGICAFVSVFASMIAYSTADGKTYNEGHMFAEAIKEKGDMDAATKTALVNSLTLTQIGKQAAGIFAAAGTALVTGGVTGLIVSMWSSDDHWYDEDAHFD